MISEKRIEEYLDSKAALKRAQALEKELRLELLSSAFGEGKLGKVSTAHRNYMIKGTFGTTMTLNKKMFEEALDEGEFDGTDVDSCISWKPSILKAKYEELGEHDLDKLNEFIVVKPSLPTIEIKLLPEE